MQTASLPFLIVYGDWVALAAAVVVALLSVWSLRRARIRLAARRTRAVLDELGPTTPPGNFANGAQAVLEGTLEFSSDVQLSGTLRAVPARVPAIIDLGSEATLRGASDWEIAGSSELAWGNEVSLAEDNTELEMRLHPGTQVRIRGRLEASPRTGGTEDTQGYRDASVQWKLIGTDESPLTIVSCLAPRPRVSMMRGLGAATTGLILFAIFTGIVGATLAKSDLVDPIVSGDSVHYPLSTQLVAALPFHREDALDRLEYEFGWNSSLPEARAAIALKLLRGDCPGAVERALYLNRWDYAKKLLTDCGPDTTGEVAYRVYLNRGEFQEASAALLEHRPRSVDWRGLANVHILAGNYAEAAAVLAEEAEARSMLLALPDSERPDGHPPRTVLKAEEERLRCLAAASRELAGLPSNADVFDLSSPVCKLLRTERLDDASQRTAMHMKLVAGGESYNLSKNWVRPSLAYWHELLALAAPPERDFNRSLRISFYRLNLATVNSVRYSGPSSSFSLHLGLLSAAHRSLQSDEKNLHLRGRIRLELAYWKLMLGDEETGLRLAKLARIDLLGGAPVEVQEFVREIDACSAPRECQQALSIEDLWSVQDADRGLNRLKVTELLLAGLATRRGDNELARRHVDTAMALTRDDNHTTDFGDEGFVDVPALLGKRPTLWPTHLARMDHTPSPAHPVRQEMLLHAEISASYLRIGIEGLLKVRAEIEHLDEPQWQAEIDSAIHNWSEVLWNKDRSLLLLLLNHVGYDARA